MSYYDILELPKTATIDEIKKQYKKRALKHHPDRGGNPKMYQKISEAYQTLSDPEQRRQYDNPNPFYQQRPKSANHTSHFVDPNILFQQFFHDTNIFEQENIDIPRTNTTSFNINIGLPRGNGQVFQKSVSTQIQGDKRIETTTEIRNGVKTQTIKQVNMKTGEMTSNINRITS